MATTTTTPCSIHPHIIGEVFKHHDQTQLVRAAETSVDWFWACVRALKELDIIEYDVESTDYAHSPENFRTVKYVRSKFKVNQLEMLYNVYVSLTSISKGKSATSSQRLPANHNNNNNNNIKNWMDLLPYCKFRRVFICARAKYINRIISRGFHADELEIQEITWCNIIYPFSLPVFEITLSNLESRIQGLRRLTYSAPESDVSPSHWRFWRELALNLPSPFVVNILKIEKTSKTRSFECVKLGVEINNYEFAPNYSPPIQSLKNVFCKFQYLSEVHMFHCPLNDSFLSLIPNHVKRVHLEYCRLEAGSHINLNSLTLDELAQLAISCMRKGVTFVLENFELNNHLWFNKCIVSTTGRIKKINCKLSEQIQNDAMSRRLVMTSLNYNQGFLCAGISLNHSERFQCSVSFPLKAGALICNRNGLVLPSSKVVDITLYKTSNIVSSLKRLLSVSDPLVACFNYPENVKELNVNFFLKGGKYEFIGSESVFHADSSLLVPTAPTHCFVSLEKLNLTNVNTVTMMFALRSCPVVKRLKVYLENTVKSADLLPLDGFNYGLYYSENVKWSHFKTSIEQLKLLNLNWSGSHRHENLSILLHMCPNLQELNLEILVPENEDNKSNRQPFETFLHPKMRKSQYALLMTAKRRNCYTKCVHHNINFKQFSSLHPKFFRFALRVCDAHLDPDFKLSYYTKGFAFKCPHKTHEYLRFDEAKLNNDQLL